MAQEEPFGVFKTVHPLNINESYGPKKNVNDLTSLLCAIQNDNKDPALDHLIQRCREIVDRESEYVEEACSSETSIQKKIVQDTEEDMNLSEWTFMLSGKIGGCFLKHIAEIGKAKRIMEIGMFTGFSAVTFAETSNCEEVVCLEIDPDMKMFLKSRIEGTKLDDKIRIIVGPAQESLVKLKQEGKQFDLIYIDADKGGYLDYYKYIMDNDMLDKSTGVILCDNILWNHTTVDQSSPGGKSLHEFVEYVRQDGRVTQMIIQISDGIFMIKPKNL